MSLEKRLRVSKKEVELYEKRSEELRSQYFELKEDIENQSTKYKEYISILEYTKDLRSEVERLEQARISLHKVIDHLEKRVEELKELRNQSITYLIKPETPTQTNIYYNKKEFV